MPCDQNSDMSSTTILGRPPIGSFCTDCSRPRHALSSRANPEKYASHDCSAPHRGEPATSTRPCPLRGPHDCSRPVSRGEQSQKLEPNCPSLETLGALLRSAANSRTPSVYFLSESFCVLPLVANSSLSSRASQPMAAATMSAGAATAFLMAGSVSASFAASKPQISPATSPMS